MPSTAAWSAASLSPLPTSGAHASAAASVTRTISSARLRSGSWESGSAFTGAGNLYQGRGHYDPGVSDQELTVKAHLPTALGPAIEPVLSSARSERVAERLNEGDATLWGPAGAPEIANRLGWLTIAERMLDELEEIETFAAGVIDEELADVVLLGMGGSSLAPEVLRRTFPTAAGRPRLHVLDSTDAATIAAVQDAIEPRRTLFIVSS